MSASLPFSPFASGLGMMPGNSPYNDKNSTSAQQASSNMNASKSLIIQSPTVYLRIYSISDWYAMAQMAAQDYFSRLQMSGMVHPDMSNFSSMAALNSVHNNSPSATGSSGNKHNLKRRDKGSHQEDFNKPTMSKEVKQLS